MGTAKLLTVPGTHRRFLVIAFLGSLLWWRLTAFKKKISNFRKCQQCVRCLLIEVVAIPSKISFLFLSSLLIETVLECSFRKPHY